MQVEPFDENRSKFTCTIGSRLNPVYQFLSFIIRLTFWAQAHADEETPYFADSAARWATRNDSERRASDVSPSMEVDSKTPKITAKSTFGTWRTLQGETGWPRTAGTATHLRSLRLSVEPVTGLTNVLLLLVQSAEFTAKQRYATA